MKRNKIMISDINHSDCNRSAPAVSGPLFQAGWLPPECQTDSYRQTNQVFTSPMLPGPHHQHTRFPESLGKFYTNLHNISDDAQKITAMSPREVRAFLTHGDSHIDNQVVDSLFEIMQSIENQFFHLRRLIIPFALSSPETTPDQEKDTLQLEPSDDDDLPIMLSPAPVLVTEDSPASSPNPMTDNYPMTDNCMTTAVLDKEPAPSARTRRTSQINRKQNALNRELQIPESLNQILDTIISCTIHQRDQAGYQADIISCYNRLADSARGKDIIELLHAVLLPETEVQACTALFALQLRIAVNEPSITINQLRDLQRYLASEMFNGKKVNFKLMDVRHYLNLRTRPEFFDNLPPALSKLVSYLIETTLSLRATETVAIKKWIFLNQMQGSNRRRQAVKLLGAIAASPPNYKIIHEIHTELNDTCAPYPTNAVIRPTISRLKKFLKAHFFSSWLFAFNVSELNSANEEDSAPKSKGGKAREQTRQEGYYRDPSYFGRL